MRTLALFAIIAFFKIFRELTLKNYFDYFISASFVAGVSERASDVLISHWAICDNTNAGRRGACILFSKSQNRVFLFRKLSSFFLIARWHLEGRSCVKLCWISLHVRSASSGSQLHSFVLHRVFRDILVPDSISGNFSFFFSSLHFVKKAFESNSFFASSSNRFMELSAGKQGRIFWIAICLCIIFTMWARSRTCCAGHDWSSSRRYSKIAFISGLLHAKIFATRERRKSSLYQMMVELFRQYR